jgi:hypothetical protein
VLGSDTGESQDSVLCYRFSSSAFDGSILRFFSLRHAVDWLSGLDHYDL